MAGSPVSALGSPPLGGPACRNCCNSLGICHPRRQPSFASSTRSKLSLVGVALRLCSAFVEAASSDWAAALARAREAAVLLEVWFSKICFSSVWWFLGGLVADDDVDEGDDGEIGRDVTSSPSKETNWEGTRRFFFVCDTAVAA